VDSLDHEFLENLEFRRNERIKAAREETKKWKALYRTNARELEKAGNEIKRLKKEIQDLKTPRTGEDERTGDKIFPLLGGPEV